MYTCFVLVSSQLSDYNLLFISWTREEENGISVKKMFWCCVSGYKGRKIEKKKKGGGGGTLSPCSDQRCVCSVPQLCLTLFNSMDCSPSGSSVHGISQAKILERVAISSWD